MEYKVIDGKGVIPDGATDVGEGAFKNCVGLQSVVIPDSVTKIWSSAFLLKSSKAAKGEQEHGSRGDQQGHRAVVAFHPKGFRCACGKENGFTYSYHSGQHSFASIITLEAGVPISLKNIRQFWEIEPAWIP